MPERADRRLGRATSAGGAVAGGRGAMAWLLAREGRAGALPGLLAAAALVALAVAPEFLNLYWLRLISYAFMYGVLAQGLNLIAGYTGYPAFGNVVFFGLGAYGTAITMVRYGGSFALGMAVGVAVAVAFALAFGPPLLRLRGHYFAIATVGLNEAVKAVATNMRGFTGGGMGMSVPLPPGTPAETSVFFYHLLLGLLVLGVLLTWWFSRSRLGHACRAVRDNELKAEAMGIHTVRAKTAAWVLGAALTGAAGGVYAYWLSYIEPPAVFNMMIAVKSFVIFLLGGGGTVLGPVAAAFLIELVTTLAWSHLLHWHLGLLGVIIIAVIMFMPNGLARFVRERPMAWRPFRRRGAGTTR
jgi:branched-chain amino acid transport system permease protein